MSRTVGNWTMPTAADIKDTNDNQEWERLDAFLQKAGLVIDTDGTIVDGTVFAGDVEFAAAADVDLLDNTASALSFDATGKSGILEIVTTNAGEKIKASGGCDVAGQVNADATTASTDGATGALVCDGGLGVAKDIFATGKINTDDTTESTSKTTGALISDGGLAVAKNAFVSGEIRTDKNVGAVQAGSTVVEKGDATHHTSVITVDTVFGAIAGGADLCLGKKIYIFPAGAVIVKAAYMTLALDEVDGNITADTPEVGLGAVLGTGAHATIGAAGATMENIIDGTAAADCNGTATVLTIGDQILVIETGDAHDVFINIADGWAASGETACPVAGTVVLEWMFLA